MNKKIVPYISWVVVLWFIVVAILFTTKDTEAPIENLVSTGKINTWTVQVGNKNMSEGDLKENMNLWQKYAEWKIWSLKCEIQIKENWWIINQVVYISWEKIRMDSNVSNEAGSSESFMINDGEYTYVWWTNWPAIKMKNETETETSVEKKDLDIGINQDDEYGDVSKILEQIPYNKCSEWKNDNSMFTIPVWIDFMDMNQFQNDMMKKTAEWMWMSMKEMEKMMNDLQWSDK